MGSTKVFTVETSTFEYQTRNARYPEFDSTPRAASKKIVETNQLGDNVNREARTKVVYDALNALVTDVNATAEVLRQKHLGRDVGIQHDTDGTLERRMMSTSYAVEEKPKSPPPPVESPEPWKEMRPTSAVSTDVETYSPPQSRNDSRLENNLLEDFGIDLTPRSRTPAQGYYSTQSLRSASSLSFPDGRKTPVAYPICASCNEEIRGKILTALAVNSPKAMKFHPEHFVCTYCLKPLNLKGTYKEHRSKETGDRPKPYCAECSYRLFSGLIM